MSGKIPRTALVTSGTAGEPGLSIARALSEDGFAVVLQHPKSRPLPNQLTPAFSGLSVDLTCSADMAALFATVANMIGPTGVLVHCSGPSQPSAENEESCANLDLRCGCNLHTSLTLARQFADALPDGAQGAIFVVVDPGSTDKVSGHSWRVADDSIRPLIKSLALELAPRIRVNAVAFSVAMSRQPVLQDVVRSVVTFLMMPSVTGEMLTLSAEAQLPWHSAVPARRHRD